MKIKKIIIENYRGIKIKQEIPLSAFTSFVGKNDSGKSIVLNAIATFLDSKNYPTVESDFNNPREPIQIDCHFIDSDLRSLLEGKIKSKIKKNDGLDEFLNDILFDNTLIFQKIITEIGKNIQAENILMKDFDHKDLSILYSKTDEELSEILEKYKIIIPVKGKGRNSKLEKIKYIKEFCSKNKIPEIISSISDEYKVSSLLPSVKFFVSDYGIKTDTSFKTNSVSEIQDYFSRETKDDSKKFKKIEIEIQQEMTHEAEAIREYMIDYTPSLKKVEIIPNIVWKDAIKSVDVNFQFDGDYKPIPMSHKGSGYRRLFMVARFRYLAEKNKGKNIIYLIEEPETYLHPSAQEDLLNAFKDLALDNQILITTHSPVFAGSTDYDAVILCWKEDQSFYEFATEDSKTDFVMQIVEELGIKPSYNLRDHHEKIVFVESKNDIVFYNTICNHVLNKNLIKNEKILVLPFGGGDDIDSFINIDYFSKSQRNLFLLIDSDKHKGNQGKRKQKIDEFSEREKATGYMLKKSCIENYYHPRAFERN